MNTWEVSILKCISSLGGEAISKRIYERIAQFRQLSERNLAESKYGDRPNFEHAVRSFCTSLCRKKEIERIDRGHFRITAKGRTRIAAF